jgi:hypothetical protein
MRERRNAREENTAPETRKTGRKYVSREETVWKETKREQMKDHEN